MSATKLPPALSRCFLRKGSVQLQPADISSLQQKSAKSVDFVLICSVMIVVEFSVCLDVLHGCFFKAIYVRD